jgi:hypothetical protein
MSMMLGLNLAITNQLGGGDGAPALAPLIIIAMHQSNMTGGQTNAFGATIISPDDDAVANIKQVSPNGGGAYPAQNPTFALVEDDARGNLRYPVGVYATSLGVGPAFSYAKAVKAANPGRKIIIITAGVGGTSMSEYTIASGIPTNWPKNRWNMTKDALVAAQTLNPTAIVHSFISSFLENEMSNQVPDLASLPAGISTYITDLRTLPGCSSATPFVFSSPLPEWLGNDISSAKLGYLLAGAKAAILFPNVGFRRRYRGNTVTQDPIHATNVGNRIEGGLMYPTKLLADGFQTTAPDAPVLTLPTDSDIMQITANGAPFYDIFARSPPGSGAYTKFEMVPFEGMDPGTVLKMPIPLSGSRDVYVVAKSRAGDSAPSTVRTFTVPAPSVPTPIFQAAFTDADGSDNLLTIPSIGSDTTAWTVRRAAATGAAALVKRQLIGGAYGVVLNTLNVDFFRDTYAFPAGDYTLVNAVYVGSGAINGAFITGAGASIDIHFGGANSGINYRLNHNSSSVQKLTTANPFNFNTAYWLFLAVTYNRTSNTAILMANDEVVTFPGTLTQRSASPGTTGGVKLLSNFPTGTLALPPRVYNAELSFAQLAKIKDEYKQAHGITFGVLPAIAA